MTERGFLLWSRRPNADLIRPDLRGNKRPVFRQLFVDEFHFSAVVKCFEPADVNKIVRAVEHSCDGLRSVDPIRIASKTIGGLCNGATTKELDFPSIQTAVGHRRLNAGLLAWWACLRNRYSMNTTIPDSRLYIEPAIFMLPLDSSSRSTGLFSRMLAIVSDTFFRATASTNA